MFYFILNRNNLIKEIRILTKKVEIFLKSANFFLKEFKGKMNSKNNKIIKFRKKNNE